MQGESDTLISKGYAVWRTVLAMPPPVTLEAKRDKARVAHAVLMASLAPMATRPWQDQVTPQQKLAIDTLQEITEREAVL